MFRYDYRDLEFERHLQLRDQRHRHHRYALEADRRPERRLLAPLGRALLSLGSRLAPEPLPQRARPR
jgi:hypothetical protein